MSNPLLQFDDVSIARRAQPEKPIVDSLSFHVDPGERVGIVGESGSGKSLTCLSIMGLLDDALEVSGGAVRFDGEDLTVAGPDRLRELRGASFSMVYQEPLTSLNPLMSVGSQIAEAIRSGGKRRQRVLQALADVGIRNPDRVINQRPHELSGGMRQRVVIAMAMINSPQLLIADEPTTALDATIQDQVLRLMHTLSVRTNTAILLVSHDLGAVARLVDRVIVMRHGRIVESGPTEQILSAPSDPYTRLLIDSAPQIGVDYVRLAGAQPGQAAGTIDLGRPAASVGIVDPSHERIEPDRPRSVLRAVQLSKSFRLPGRLFERGAELVAARDVTFSIPRGRTLGIVGETGSGKSTVANMLMGLETPSSGEIYLDGALLGAQRTRAQRRAMQIVFQDPYSSLNPRMRVFDSVAEPLRAQGVRDHAQLSDRVTALLKLVRLPADAAARFPHEFSGGQRQRIVIARALVLDPQVLILDEAVSALDVSVQSQILNLLKDLQDELGLTYVFIGHGLETVYFMSDEVMVMYHGEVIERASAEDLYENPQQDYTRRLLAVARDRTRYG